MSFDQAVADVQSTPDQRNYAVTRVGVKQVRHPAFFANHATVATFDMMVNLPKQVKGTHMSRFIEILNAEPVHLDLEKIPRLVETMVSKLQASYGYLKASFPYFLNKKAPISQAESLMDYDINIYGIYQEQKAHTYVDLIVPVTSLCPCSKQISNYGAHNQRSHVSLTLEVLPGLDLAEIIQLTEEQASSELYGILKRADEKAVTERAYDNPKFVEDMVRDMAVLLAKHPAIASFKISSENFESIHNHSAFAEIDRLRVPAPEQTTTSKLVNQLAEMG